MEAVKLSEDRTYPYYVLDDDGNINDMLFTYDYQQKTLTSENIYDEYYNGDVSHDLFLCKSCLKFKSLTSSIKLASDKPNKTKKFRLELLHERICWECSGRITKQIGINNIIKKWKDPEFKTNFKNKMSGPNHPNWKGGIKYEPYCYLFNESFKERVRDYWQRNCGLCGKPESKNNRRLSVHHVSYDKDTCCNTTIPLFIPLCNVCHSKTSHNRDYWEEILSNYIMIYFNGECYFK